MYNVIRMFFYVFSCFLCFPMTEPVFLWFSEKTTVRGRGENSGKQEKTGEITGKQEKTY